EQNFVTTHVVIINWLLQQRGRATKQHFLGLTGTADLMQAKTGVQKSRAGLGGSAAKAAANSQGARPLLLAHQVMQAQLQDFWAMLVFILDRIQLRNRLSRHAEFGIATGRAKLSFEVHAIENKQPACQKNRNCRKRRGSTAPPLDERRWATPYFARYLYSTLQSRGAAAGSSARMLVVASHSGEHTRPRVSIAAPRRNVLQRKSSRWRGRHRQHARRVRSQKEATVPSRFNCGACYLALLTLTRHLLRENQLKKGLEFAKSLLK